MAEAEEREGTNHASSDFLEARRQTKAGRQLEVSKGAPGCLSRSRWRTSRTSIRATEAARYRPRCNDHPRRSEAAMRVFVLRSGATEAAANAASEALRHSSGQRTLDRSRWRVPSVGHPFSRQRPEYSGQPWRHAPLRRRRKRRSTFSLTRSGVAPAHSSFIIAFPSLFYRTIATTPRRACVCAGCYEVSLPVKPLGTCKGGQWDDTRSFLPLHCRAAFAFVDGSLEKATFRRCTSRASPSCSLGIVCFWLSDPKSQELQRSRESRVNRSIESRDPTSQKTH